MGGVEVAFPGHGLAPCGWGWRWVSVVGGECREWSGVPQPRIMLVFQNAAASSRGGCVVPEAYALAPSQRVLGSCPFGSEDAGTCQSAVHRMSVLVGESWTLAGLWGPLPWKIPRLGVQAIQEENRAGCWPGFDTCASCWLGNILSQTARGYCIIFIPTVTLALREERERERERAAKVTWDRIALSVTRAVAAVCLVWLLCTVSSSCEGSGQLRVPQSWQQLGPGLRDGAKGALQR